MRNLSHPPARSTPEESPRYVVPPPRMADKSPPPPRKISSKVNYLGKVSNRLKGVRRLVLVSSLLLGLLGASRARRSADAAVVHRDRRRHNKDRPGAGEWRYH